MALTLRNYQEEAIASVQTGKKNLIVLPTGTGKSLVILGIYERYKNALVVTHRLPIIKQLKSLGLPVTSRQKFLKSKEPLPDVLIIDEAHYSPNKLFSLPIQTIIGLTATPVTPSNKLMTNTEIWIEPLTYVQAFSLGWLLKPTFVIPFNPDYSQVKLIGGDYDDKLLKLFYEQARIFDRAKPIIQSHLNQHKYILYFAVSIQTAEAELLELNHQYKYIIHSKLPNVEEIIDKFKETGGLLINVQMLQVGFDLPAVSLVVNMRATVSMSLYFQILGRLLRPFEGKSGVMLDFSGATARFQPLSMDSWKLLPIRTGCADKCQTMIDNGTLPVELLDDCVSVCAPDLRSECGRASVSSNKFASIIKVEGSPCRVRHTEYTYTNKLVDGVIIKNKQCNLCGCKVESQFLPLPTSFTQLNYPPLGSYNTQYPLVFIIDRRGLITEQTYKVHHMFFHPSKLFEIIRSVKEQAIYIMDTPYSVDWDKQEITDLDKSLKLALYHTAQLNNYKQGWVYHTFNSLDKGKMLAQLRNKPDSNHSELLRASNKQSFYKHK